MVIYDSTVLRSFFITLLPAFGLSFLFEPPPPSPFRADAPSPPPLVFCHIHTALTLIKFIQKSEKTIVSLSDPHLNRRNTVVSFVLLVNYLSAPVMRIHDIWCGSRSGSADPCLWLFFFSGSGSWIRILIFSSLTFKILTKNKLFLRFYSACYFLNVQFTSFFKDKNSKSVTK